MEQTHLDFGTGGAHDLSAVQSMDLGGAPDLAAPDSGGASDFAVAETSDFAVGEDLAPEPDLRPPVHCDLSAGPPSALWVAGVGASNALYAARFTPSGGWHTVTVDSAPTVFEVAMSTIGGVPALADRNHGTSSVDLTLWNGCGDQFPAPSQIVAGATTLQRPALVVNGAGADVVFRGSTSGDQRLYHSHSPDGVTWSTPVAQSNFLSIIHPAAANYRSAIHALFAGTNSDLYDGTVSDSAGGGSAVEIGSDTVQVTAAPPAAIVDGSGRLVVVWTQTDKNLEFIVRSADGLSTTGPSLLSMTTPKLLGPALALDSGGNVTVAFSGEDKQLYTATLGGTTWGSATLSGGSCTTGTNMGDCHSTLAPALATGTGGDELELLYVRDSDGKLAHARRISGVWQAPTLVTTSTNFLTQPAAVTTP
jgi:hypothetical protein